MSYRQVYNVKNHLMTALYFLVGAAGYCLIEILWRGFTHPAMGIAGGIGFLTILHIEKSFAQRSIVYCAFLCALCITGVELVFGILLNLVLKLAVWDYSDRSFNLFGQICPMYSGLWFALSLALTYIVRGARRDKRRTKTVG